MGSTSILYATARPNRAGNRLFTPDVEAYKRLKDEHPRRLVGVRVDDTLLFYGEDAQTAAPLMDTRLFERDIPGMGTISVTGIPFWTVERCGKAFT